jgi:peptidoglycan/xylan/chitin deacetylase (PgdA/CDA1 family)
MGILDSCLQDGFHLRAWLLRRRQERALADLCRRTRSLVLTYDDGPGPMLTERLLDLLAARDCRAVFFLLARSVPRGHSTLDRMKRDGHEIGCHGQEHLSGWRVSPARAVADLDAGYQTASRWMDSDAIFRPPYGKPCGAVYRRLDERGSRIGWWTIDSGDTFDRLPSSPEVVVEALRQAGGGVVLMHDFDRDAQRGEYVLETTRRLIELARHEGLAVRRFADLWAVAGDGPSPR